LGRKRGVARGVRLWIKFTAQHQGDNVLVREKLDGPEVVSLAGMVAEGIEMDDLPTGLWRDARNLHAVDSTSWSRNIVGAIRRAMEILFVPWSTGKLHGQTFTFEVAAICNQEVMSKEGILK
jgi:hypothetical protein